MNLKKIRKDKGLTQNELAKKLGMRPSAISRYEHEFRSPNLKTAQKLAEILGCSIDDLIEDKKEK